MSGKAWIVMEGSYEIWVVAVCSTLERAREIEATPGKFYWVEEWILDDEITPSITV